MRAIFSTIFVLLFFFVQAEKTKQAMRALEKAEFEKVEEIVNRSLAKDSLNPASLYVFAVLFSIDSFPGYNIDVAHRYVLLSEQNLDETNEDYVDEFEKADLTFSMVQERKHFIDSLAWDRAMAENSVGSYNYFLEKFSGADQIKLAISNRNELIFAAVERQNSWQSYQQFANEFPLAEQVPIAMERFKKLVYEEKTASRKTEDLISFLDEYPDTPYRIELESEIFSRSITNLNEEKISWFLSKYDNPRLTRTGLSLLYHLEQKPGDWIRIQAQNKTFFDSASVVTQIGNEALLVTLDHLGYQFVDFSNQPILDATFSKVSDQYFCGNVQSDVLLVEQDGERRLINRTGESIVSGDFELVRDIGGGLLAVKQGGKEGLYHKAGFELIEAKFDRIELFEGRLLMITVDDRIGLATLDGNWVIKPKFDAFYKENQYWFYEMEGGVGLAKAEQIFGGRRDFPAKYEEVEMINEKYLVGYDGDYEVLINEELKEVVPGGVKRINTRFETWVMELEDGYKIFDHDLDKLSEATYESLLQNEEWLCLKRHGKWSVYNKNIYDDAIVGIDSVNLIGQDLVTVFRGAQGMAIFPNKKFVEFEKGEHLQSIGQNTENHFLVIRRENQNLLYRNGEELFRTDYPEIGYISDSAFFVKEKKKYGAVGLNGKLIMRVRYDAIGQALVGVSPVLFEGKFGAYNFSDRVLLKLDYDQKLKAYNDQLFITLSEGKFGLIDRMNNEILSPTFDQIQYWSDSSMLARDGDEWVIYKWQSDEEVLDSVLDYELMIEHENEKILIVRAEDGYGVYHSSKGMLVPPSFNDIINLGSEANPVYFCEKSIAEADYYVVVYYDSNGKRIKSAAYNSEQYERIVCDR